MRVRPALLVDCYLDDAGASSAFLPQFDGRPAEVVRAAHGGLPQDLVSNVDRFAAVVITGSAASVLDGIDWVEQLLGFIRDARQRGVPMLGVCFGHQALAQALLGPGSVRRASEVEVGWERIESLSPDELLDALGPSFTTFLSHEDEVVAPVVVDRGANVLARSRRCAVQALRLPGERIWGVQFHAELPHAECEALVRGRAKSHPDSKLDPQALLAGAVDSTNLARALFGGFFRLAHAS